MALATTKNGRMGGPDTVPTLAAWGPGPGRAAKVTLKLTVTVTAGHGDRIVTVRLAVRTPESRQAPTVLSG